MLESRQGMADARVLRIPAGDALLEGELVVPEGSRGLVVFARGDSGGRFSHRKQFLAAALRRRGLSTWLCDLLTPQEQCRELAGGRLRFDLDLLAQRLVRITDWLSEYGVTRGLPVGYWGADTGAAAAVLAAIRRSDTVKALVCRGGCLDLVRCELSGLLAPTLVVVARAEQVGWDRSREALEQARARYALSVLDAPAEGLDDVGALQATAQDAADWFVTCFKSPQSAPALG